MLKKLFIDPLLTIENLNDVYKEPKIIRVTEFNDDGLEEFVKDMDEAHRTGQPVIPIVIDSYGGFVYSLLGYLAAIESATRPVATVVTSKAMSCGAILFCYGTDGYRYMHPEACLMIHDLSWGAYGKVEDMKVDTAHLNEMNQRMQKRVSRRLGHPPDYLGNLIKSHHHVDWFLSAKDAKRHNIANHLRVPNFEIKIEVNVSFE